VVPSVQVGPEPGGRLVNDVLHVARLVVEVVVDGAVDQEELAGPVSRS
jgi:hypothetical protein